VRACVCVCAAGIKEIEEPKDGKHALRLTASLLLGITKIHGLKVSTHMLRTLMRHGSFLSIRVVEKDTEVPLRCKRLAVVSTMTKTQGP